MSKTARFRGPFDKQHGKRGQALLKSTLQHLDDIHRSLPRKLSWKKSLLLTCQILGLVVHALAADDKYLVLDRDNFTLPIYMQFSQKQNTFSDFFLAILKSILNVENFEKKDDPHRFGIFEVTVCENVVR